MTATIRVQLPIIVFVLRNGRRQWKEIHTTATINKLKQQACNRKPDEHGDGVVY